MPAKSNASIAKSVCRMCLSSCGIDAHVENGKLVRVSAMKEHPIHRLCVKATVIPDWLYSSRRAIHPLKKVNGEWQETSWDDALGIIAEKLGDIKADYGAKSLVVHLGEPLVGTAVPRLAVRFCSLFGTPNYTSGASLCFAARGIGHGLSVNRRMFPLAPSYAETRCVVVWGRNPEQSKIGEEADVLAAQKRGAKLIVVDPRATSLAKKADLHIQLKPGTDCLLALSLMQVIIAEELYDKDFVDRWTFGFDKLKKHVRSYSPEAVAGITGVAAAKIRQFARMYATTKPAAITQGVSLDHCVNGVQNSRAISVLIAITGNLDIAGGNTYDFPLPQTSLRVKGRVKVDEAIGAQYPIFNKFVSETSAMPVTDAILTGKPYPVKALIVQGCNPALTWPDSDKVRRAFERLDLLVVSDLFLTETAEMADVFLPAAAFLEGKLIMDYATKGIPLIIMGQKAVEPPGECKEDWQLWSELGKKMGYADYFPWRDTDELFTYLLKPSGITLEQLEQNPGGIFYGDYDHRRKYEEVGFDTPSGKVEIFSPTLAAYGYDPLPTFTPMAKPSDDYPFTLISGTRTMAYTHSQYRDIARLKRLTPEPLVEINPELARELGIADGEMVIVESARGSITLKARITPDVPPTVLSLQHGWKEANANLLTDNEPCDPISGYPAFKTTPCQVKKTG
ncbi:MAG: molybdopterin-dependent oxidoreductase [Chloroflexi bacterium]|nr:molybdopterin-dependent oxidoreductase [Chloroflexota bacterium]